MVSDNKTGLRRNESLSGFSLIELLVVIAIIALLAAIIFPVFASVRENGRQSSSMSNLHDISVKMEQYRLDTQHYPPVLFGYVVKDSSGNAVSMDKALDTCQANNSCSTYLTGLYPEYVKSWTEFEDPNNTAKLNDTYAPAQTYLCSGTSSDTESACGGTAGKLVLQSQPQAFYKADAYDMSPQAVNGNTISSTTYITRYQTSWTSMEQTLDCGTSNNTTAISEGLCTSTTDPSLKVNLYLNQLRWHNPPSDTYVTSTTYHVPQAGIVLVLMQDGGVHKMDAATFAAKYDALGPLTIDSNGVVNGGTSGKPPFWQITY